MRGLGFPLWTGRSGPLVAAALGLIAGIAAEVALLAWLGAQLGIGWTFVLVLVSGVVGGWLAKREGIGLLRELSDELKQGLPPGTRLTEGALVVVGGLLLIAPGVLSDVAGVLLLLRPTRRWLAPRVLGALSSRFGALDDGDAVLDGGVRVRRGPPPAPAEAAPPRSPFASKFDDLP